MARRGPLNLRSLTRSARSLAAPQQLADPRADDLVPVGLALLELAPHFLDRRGEPLDFALYALQLQGAPLCAHVELVTDGFAQQLLRVGPQRITLRPLAGRPRRRGRLLRASRQVVIVPA